MIYQVGSTVASLTRKFQRKTALKRIQRTGKTKASVLLRSEAEISELVLEHRENARKLARSLLRKWRVRMPAEETDSIVDLTLCEAAQRFNPNRGASFMTFLYYHLRGNLVRAISTAAKANNFVVAFAQNAGLEVGEWGNLRENANWAFLPEFSLFAQSDSEVPENILLRQENIEICRDAIGKLDELEQEIIFRSFGQEEALVDIAKTLGYSRCHVSRVKKRALERLKHILEEKEGTPRASSEETSGSSETRRRPVKRRARRRQIKRTAQTTALAVSNM